MILPRHAIFCIIASMSASRSKLIAVAKTGNDHKRMTSKRPQTTTNFQQMNTNYQKINTNYQQTTANGHLCTSNQKSDVLLLAPGVITRNTPILNKIPFK